MFGAFRALSGTVGRVTCNVTCNEFFIQFPNTISHPDISVVLARRTSGSVMMMVDAVKSTGRFVGLDAFVPLAVAVLAPVLVNILTFHALMAPSGLPLALFVTVLWALIFIDVRPAFSGLFQSRLQPRA